MRQRRRRSRRLSVPQILAWIDAHRARTGDWPRLTSGRVCGGPSGESWGRIDQALCRGGRGLPGGSSLARLLHAERGVDNRIDRPGWTVAQVLEWAEAHLRRTGRWPTVQSGSIPGTGENWRRVDNALRYGLRGLPSGLSLARLLARDRGVRHRRQAPRLTLRRILVWADDHFQRTGCWPHAESGPVSAAPSETWSAVDSALKTGGRGLAARTSLGRLLAARRRLRNHTNIPLLSVPQVLAWADSHYARTGTWPHAHSGRVADAPQESWAAVHTALRHGRRGLPGKLSLYRLLRRHRLLPGPPPPIRAWRIPTGQRGAWPIRLEFPADLLAQARSGAQTLGQVARLCHVSRHLAARELRRAGVQPLPGGRPPLGTLPWHREVVELYRTGHHLRQLAARFHCSHELIRLILIRAGVPRRHQGDEPS